MISLSLSLHILCLALGVAANPLPTKKPCTTYVTKIIGGAYMPETVYTVYTTTETVYSLVPCKGCVLATTTLYAPAPPGGAGWPWDGTTTTITATGPYNTTSTICSPTHGPHITPILTARDDTAPGNQDPNEDPLLDPAKLTITHPKTTKTTTAGECPGPYTITSETGKPAITLPDPGRTNPIEPTTTYAVFVKAARDTAGLDHPPPPPVTTVTITSKSWSVTTTKTKYTTCYLGPYQDPDPGAIPKRCVTPPLPTATVYKTVVVAETGTLTRTTVKCTKTALTRRPGPTYTLDG